MKEHVEVITDSFTDYAGKVHHFVIAALSQNLPTCTCELENNPSGEEHANVTHEVGIYIEDYGTEDYLGTVSKVIRLGISMCNPTDEFDEKVGTLKAIARAEKAAPVLYAANPGVINTRVVRALLEQEAEYLKHNPENFINGYADMRDRYLTRQKMEAMHESFSDVEKKVVEGVQKDPKFLDNVMQYLEYMRKQKKGCQN